jgi:GLPGLI family protein
MKTIIILTVFCFIGLVATAQPRFITSGKIEFERKINVHKQLESDSWGEQMKKNLPQHKTDYFDLYFNEAKTLYKPGREVAVVKVPDYILGPAAENVVFTDLNEQKFVSRKAVFENTYLIEDNLRKADWKITSDTRTIAGFECRKATTIILDSVFVVAFYTDQIITAGGPESFSGLPGMILGLAIPRMSATWFATKLEMVDIKETDVAAPTKGKKGNLIEVGNQIKSSMKNWGNNADRFIWKINI